MPWIEGNDPPKTKVVFYRSGRAARWMAGTGAGHVPSDSAGGGVLCRGTRT